MMKEYQSIHDNLGEPPKSKSSIQHESTSGNSFTIEMHVDTTELDIAIEKARELESILKRLSRLGMLL